jgi:hypothetical protein
MKKILNKKKYDTGTAERLASYKSPHYDNEYEEIFGEVEE